MKPKRMPRAGRQTSAIQPSGAFYVESCVTAKVLCAMKSSVPMTHVAMLECDVMLTVQNTAHDKSEREQILERKKMCFMMNFAHCQGAGRKNVPSGSQSVQHKGDGP